MMNLIKEKTRILLTGTRSIAQFTKKCRHLEQIRDHFINTNSHKMQIFFQHEMQSESRQKLAINLLKILLKEKCV